MIFTKRSLGQNFLIDKNIIDKIIGTVKITDKNIIEIGPGNGALTDKILKKKPKNLFLIEKDNILSKKLKEKFKNEKNIKIYNEDVLKFNFKSIKRKNLIIFGNLPYNISSQILVKLLKINYWPPLHDNLILMFQKELGEKIIAKHPSKNYGRLSILTNLLLDVKTKFLVSPNCFKPKPKVNSIVIHFKPKTKKFGNIQDLKNLEKITNIFFNNKRKMINKNIKKILKKDEIIRIKNIKLDMRPADIEPNIYYKITELIENR